MMVGSTSIKFLFILRNFFSRKLFKILSARDLGSTLDIGGGNFFEFIAKKNIKFTDWTTIDISDSYKATTNDPRYKFLIQDATQTDFQSNSFDSILCIQVLEHTFEPFEIFKEAVRILKPGGIAYFMAPQTGVLHLIPYHFQNITRYWLIEAASRCNVEILSLDPLGGWWQTIASRQFYFFLAAFRRDGNSGKEHRRNLLFYVLFPFMAIYTIVTMPILLLFSLGDLTEEPPNHLLIFRKKAYS